MSRLRSMLLVKLADLGDDDDPFGGGSATLNMVTMGTASDVAAALSLFNTSPDGDPLTPGVLYGPGFTAELPPTGPDDPIAQVGITITENDSAGPVLMRICRRLGWRLVDPDTGRSFG